MNFIERWFGFSPDGGNGSVEIALIVLIVALIAVAGFRKATWSDLIGLGTEPLHEIRHRLLGSG
jgi:hypothetical protein